MGNDHGALFQEKDRKRLSSDQIDYDYFSEHGEEPGAMEDAFCRRLKEVVPRLELLGHTLGEVKREYTRCAELWRADQASMSEDEGHVVAEPMSFAEFFSFVTQHPVASLDDTFTSDTTDESAVRGRYTDESVIQRIPQPLFHEEGSYYSERSYFGSLIGILRPYSVLRLLAENQVNLESDVVWQYGPLVSSGWAEERHFVPSARRRQTFMIATEGSSDAHILKRAISLLRPEVADFFRFIDVSDRHPFPGTGNLVKFAEGLAKIDVHNHVVFLFDNDAEGFDAYLRVQGLALPPNMRAMVLPELEQFRAFDARGPEGVHKADINRRAAAIECYLDLTCRGCPPARVVWTTYKADRDVFQGALEAKEAYTKAFMKQTAEAVATGTYDTSKLRTAVDALVTECSALITTLDSASHV